MRRQFITLFIVSLVLFLPAPPVDCAALDESLMLYAPFDGSADAASARGDAASTAAVAPEFRPGLRGQALVIGGVPEDRERIVDGLPAHAGGVGRNVYFSPDRNIDVEQGTVSFWLKPLDWSGADGGFNVLFRTAAGKNYFMLYKFFTGERLLHLIGEQEYWTSVQHRIGHWRPGLWRHVAATWSQEEQRLFIDGVLVCARKVRFPLRDIEPAAPISVGPGGSWNKAFIGHSLVDEFRIHDRPLTDAEIRALYGLDAHAALLDAGHVTVGRRTPVLDGAVAPFEYSLEAGGFSDLCGLAALRQSHYALSYDDENLYVAFRDSDAAGRLTGGDRVELFLVPDPGREPLHHWVVKPGGAASRGDADSGSAPAETIEVAHSSEGRPWTLEAAIPFAALGVPAPADGEVWRFNLGRVFDSEIATSVAPVAGTLADRAKFMELRFRSDAPDVRIAGLFDMEAHRPALDIEARSQADDATLTFVRITDNINNPSYGLTTSRFPLFSGGRSTPVRAAPGWLPLFEFELGDLRILENRGGVEQAIYRRRFVILDERMPMVTRFMYTLGGRRLSVSNERRAGGQVQARFLDDGGEEIWRARQPVPEGAVFFDAVFDLDFDILEPALYTVKIDHVAPDGTETETFAQDYRVPGPHHPAFHPYVDPERGVVPEPWTPVEVGIQRAAKGDRQASKLEISTWGRTYGFGGGVLFDSLVSREEELLSAPAALRLNGLVLDPAAPPEILQGEESDIAAEHTQRADLGVLRVESRIKTHFDGYCEIAMTLIPPEAGLSVRTLSLDIPLRGEAATLFRDGEDSSRTWKTGAVGDYLNQRLVSRPFFWVGNDRVGFNWLADDLESWHSRDHRNNLELIRGGGQLLVRLNLVDSVFTLDEPRTISFGFVLTPSRPLDRAVLRRREYKDFQMWCQPWEYFAYPDYDAASLRSINEWLSRSEPGADEVFLYGGDFFSQFHPDWIFWEEEWRSLRARRAYGESTGHFPTTALRKRHSYTEPCLESETFRNFYLNTYSEFAERVRKQGPLTPEATGYYFDSQPGIERCENARHGCQLWTGLDGNRYGRVGIDGIRDIRLNLYRILKRTGPDARIYYHQGFRRVMPLQHFAEIGVAGEGIGNMVRQVGAYYDVYTPESFRATFSPYIWGMKMVHLDMYVRLLRGAPDRLLAFSLDDSAHRRPLMHSYGYCVVHDVDIHDSSPQSRPLREIIWNAQDALGWDEDVIFHPYWENDAVKRLGTDTGRIMASAYTRNGKMLLAVVNDTDEDREVNLALDLSALGVEPGGEGHDVFEPGQRYKLDARWSGSVPPRGFRLVFWG